jgi:hypothetical protein
VVATRWHRNERAVFFRTVCLTNSSDGSSHDNIVAAALTIGQRRTTQGMVGKFIEEVTRLLSDRGETLRIACAGAQRYRAAGALSLPERRFPAAPAVEELEQRRQRTMEALIAQTDRYVPKRHIGSATCHISVPSRSWVFMFWVMKKL